MNSFVAPLALVLAIALSGAASAAPMYGNAQRDAAQSGFITPHGVFDGK